MQKIPELFEKLIEGTAAYLRNNHIQCMVLGISGGIDSTVCAAICREIRKRYAIPLIGRSLPLLNKDSEKHIADKVGSSYCDDFRVVDFTPAYELFRDTITNNEGLSLQTGLANGNIQCRMRMTYLYNVAGTRKGLVIDTDNMTEHYLGFFTKNGDEFDFSPIASLWKTEVYELANWLAYHFYDNKEDVLRQEAMIDSINAVPTDGLGFSTSDLEQIGANSYADVDDILQTTLCQCLTFEEAMAVLIPKYGSNIVFKVLSRCRNSHFKREKLPVPLMMPTKWIKEFGMAGEPYMLTYFSFMNDLEEYFSKID